MRYFKSVQIGSVFRVRVETWIRVLEYNVFMYVDRRVLIPIIETYISFPILF